MHLERIVEVLPKPSILWVRGADDQIVSDQSFFDFGTLGKLGFVPGWPGEDVCPPQQMVTQTRAVLERYQSRGGSYREVVIADAGHSPHIEQPEQFREAFFAHLQRR
jgi:pimeloyl-ACP methyl ester carboxylesterase